MEIINITGRYSVMLAIVLFATSEAIAGPRVDVIIGPRAPELERFAAAELAGQFKQLFDADVKIADEIPAQFTHLILIGSLETNPAIGWPGAALPRLSDQGHMV